MISDKMMQLGKKRSVIREIFEYGNARRNQIGAENVFDFSLGNPNIPAPEIIADTIKNLLATKPAAILHAYTSAQGDPGVRKAVADYITKKFGINAKPELIYMTCGAAASLAITLNAIVNIGDEVILLAPYFPEYTVFAEKAGAVIKSVKCREYDFQIDFDALERIITPKTKAIIVNSPNNPSGAVLSEQSIIELSKLLNRKSKEFGNNIFIIADEPYRELVYGGVTVPYIPCYYGNTILCYSFSKSLSLPGERIGYIFVSPKADKPSDLYAAVCGAGRALGYVCAPSLLQYTIKEVIGKSSDISIYENNRNILYNALTEYGYEAVRPDGAFYLFVKSPEFDANAFCERAKKYEILIVPGDDFGYEGYVRISYCVSTEMIKKSLEGFKKLIGEYR